MDLAVNFMVAGCPEKIYPTLSRKTLNFELRLDILDRPQIVAVIHGPQRPFQPHQHVAAPYRRGFPRADCNAQVAQRPCQRYLLPALHGPRYVIQILVRNQPSDVTTSSRSAPGNASMTRPPGRSNTTR